MKDWTLSSVMTQLMVYNANYVGKLSNFDEKSRSLFRKYSFHPTYLDIKCINLWKWLSSESVKSEPRIALHCFLPKMCRKYKNSWKIRLSVIQRKIFTNSKHKCNSAILWHRLLNYFSSGIHKWLYHFLGNIIITS